MANLNKCALLGLLLAVAVRVFAVVVITENNAIDACGANALGTASFPSLNTCENLVQNSSQANATQLSAFTITACNGTMVSYMRGDQCTRNAATLGQAGNPAIESNTVTLGACFTDTYGISQWMVSGSCDGLEATPTPPPITFRTYSDSTCNTYTSSATFFILSGCSSITQGTLSIGNVIMTECDADTNRVQYSMINNGTCDSLYYNDNLLNADLNACTFDPTTQEYISFTGDCTELLAPSISVTPTPSITPSVTPTPSATPSVTPSITPSPSFLSTTAAGMPAPTNAKQKSAAVMIAGEPAVITLIALATAALFHN